MEASAKIEIDACPIVDGMRALSAKAHEFAACVETVNAAFRGVGLSTTLSVSVDFKITPERQREVTSIDRALDATDRALLATDRALLRIGIWILGQK